jgi:hypothetical protein
VNGAGRGDFVVIRGCPPGTVQDCCEWHGSGTARRGRRSWGLAASAPTRPYGEVRPRRRLPRWQGPPARGSRRAAGPARTKRLRVLDAFGAPAL